jgi:hypothetical protein
MLKQVLSSNLTSPSTVQHVVKTDKNPCKYKGPGTNAADGTNNKRSANKLDEYRQSYRVKTNQTQTERLKLHTGIHFIITTKWGIFVKLFNIFQMLINTKFICCVWYRQNILKTEKC